MSIRVPKSTELPPNLVCPECYAKSEVATNFDTANPDAAPSPGDFIVCISCGAYLTFGDDMQQQILPQATFDALPNEVQEEMFKLRRACRLSREIMARQLAAIVVVGPLS